jgi:hypothetical protein
MTRAFFLVETTMLGWFRRPSATPVEKWATHNAKKASADDLIAAAIIQSFAKDFKHWKFVGQFSQRHDSSSGFQNTSITRKMPTKKHIEIVFLFRQTNSSDGYSNIYKYKVIGCEVNGVRVSDTAFHAIYVSWNNIVAQVRRTEEVAAEAKASMEANETKWNLAESLLGMKRNGLGVLVPVKTVEEAGQ